MTDDIEPTNDDELLSAYLDRELSADRRQALEARLESEPTLARRLTELERAGARVREVYDTVAAEPLPQGLIDLIGAASGAAPGRGEVVDLATRRTARAPRIPAWPVALAASVALAIGIALGYLLPPRGADSEFALVAATGLVAPETRLHAALETGASGSIHEIGDETAARPVLSFATSDGEFCRQLDIDGTGIAAEALACRRDGAWQIDALSFLAAGERPATGSSGIDGFRPANRASSAIEAAIDERIDGDALDTERERTLIENGWTQ